MVYAHSETHQPKTRQAKYLKMSSK